MAVRTGQTGSSDSRAVLEIKGLDKCMKDIQALVEKFGIERVGRALRTEAEIEMTEMKRRCPVDTGALRGSGHVEGPNSDLTSMTEFDKATQTGTFTGSGKANNTSVRFVFGGPAASYAVAVHENLEAIHGDGEAKFMERPLLESVPHLANRIAKRIAQEAGV